MFRPYSESLSSYQQVLNPTADTAICTLTPTEAGLYQVEVRYFYNGTAPTGSDVNNLSLRKNGVEVQRLLASGNGPSNTGDFWRSCVCGVRLNGINDVISVNAKGDATTGTVYHAVLVITKVAD